MKNKIDDLRDHLFATLEALRDKNAPMEIELARTIATVAQTIVNSAKVEVEFIKATGAAGSGFVPAETPPELPAPAESKAPPNNLRRITHRIK